MTTTRHDALLEFRRWLATFAAALKSGESSSAAAQFASNGYLRDLLALTWNIRTFHGTDAIAQAFADAADATMPTDLELEDPEAIKVVDRPRWGESIEGFFRFNLAHARGRGHIRLRRGDSGAWECWTMLTAVDELRGHPEATGTARVKGISVDGSVWLDNRNAESNYSDHSPEVLIVGAGHSGLTLAARLKVLGVDTLMVERNARVGDNWRNRYRSLYLHNEVWANHLPYFPYPPTWPVYTSKDKLADWLESYVAALDLNAWTSCALQSAEYSESDGLWTVDVRRGDGTSRTLRPRHLVLATGVFGAPRELDFVGAESFTGTIVTSQDYQFDSDAAGRKVLVVGTGSSAHDIARDYCLHGAEVTMLQRSTTCVVSVEPGASAAYASYHEHGDPVDDCDLVGAATPLPLLADLHKDLTVRIAEMDAELLAGLDRAGFKTDFGPDGSGFLMKYYRQGGGYYINVGCSELIVDGRIKIKQGVEVDHLRGGDVVFSDGTALESDVIVVATGFANMQQSIERTLGSPVADRVGPVWGLDDEGEVRAMWRETGQPGLWIMGGSFVQCRLMSKVLALQIKARQVGLVPLHRQSGESSVTSE